MNKFLLTIFLCLHFLNSFSQGDSDSLRSKDYILDATVYRRGVYRSFNEFKYNKPSITEFSFKKGHLLLKNETTGKMRLPKVRDSVWGVCDGEKIYVKCRKYNRIEIIDRYCYFQESGIKMLFAESIFFFCPLPVPYKLRGAINFNNGYVFGLDKDQMRTILEKDTELLSQFNREKNKKESFGKYIRLYNERHRDQIK